MTKPQALVIEDDENLSTIFYQALHMAGYETEVIRDGQLALERLQGDPPQLIALDLHLPRVSGEEILEALRADPRYDRCRVIVTTADARLGEYLESKVDLLLIKPIRFSQLRDLADRLKPRQRQPD